jgi:hypothetical protein
MEARVADICDGEPGDAFLPRPPSAVKVMPASPPRKETPTLPIFSFRGIEAGSQYEPGPALGFKRSECRDNGGGQISCTRLFGDLAGIPSLEIYNFYQGRLGVMSHDFVSSEYFRAFRALNERYGAPCKTDTRVWQNKIGSKFDNEVVTWCFKTGTLELSHLGSRVDYSALRYIDLDTLRNFAPHMPSGVNF